MPALDAVTQQFLADTLPYVEAVDKATAAALAFAEANAEAAKAVDTLQAALDDFGVADVAAKLDAAANRASDMRDAFVGAGEATSSLSYRFTGLAGKAEVLMLVLEELDLELDKKKAALGETGLAAAGLAAAASMTRLGEDTKVAAGAARFGVGWWRLSANAIHWIIAGSAELLAVLVPATVAAGAWAAVWMQGATNVAQHMNAVYTATEADNKMFHMTAGQAVGLGNALQKAQDAANPDVYQALGGAVNIVKERFSNLASTGLQVGKIFDTFTAKLVYDLSAAGGAGDRLNGLLSHMVPDLVGVGQLFGNIGHALLNFASDMPGLAEVLLKIADGISRVALAASGLPMRLITTVMALEEFNRWGSLAVSLMGRMGIATTELSGGMGSYFLVGDRFIGVLKNMLGVLPNIGFAIAGLASRIPVFGAAVVGATEDIQAARVATIGWIAELSALETLGIAAAAAALGFLIYKIVTARTAAQQFADSLQASVQKASDMAIITVIGNNMSQLAAKTAQATTAMRENAAGASQAGGVAGRLSGAVADTADAYGHAAAALATYRAAQVQQVTDMAHVITGAQQIASAYHISIPEAMALAQSAGVNLTGALKNQAGQWTILGLKIKDAVAGYTAMGQPVGVVGDDVLALGIQAGLTATKVSQLNQAWDQFMQGVTSGTSGLAGFETSLSNMGTGIAKSQQNLATYAGTFNVSMRQFAQSLTSFTGKGAAAWQNFNQVVGQTAPQMIDWLRQAGAEGALSGTQFTAAVRDMIAQMLPLASHSKTATSELSDLAQQAGGPATDNFKTLKAWVDQGHLSIAGLQRIVQDATVAMGNMSKVAQNLGTVLNNQVDQAISNAALKASGFYQDTNQLTAAIQRYGANSPQAIAAANRTAAAYAQAARNAQQAANSVGHLTAAIEGLHGKTIRVVTDFITQGANPNTGPASSPGERRIGQYASGTPGATPGLAVVGERGPELVRMHGGEQVVPAKETGHLLAIASAVRHAAGYQSGTPGAAARAAAVPAFNTAGVGGGPVTVHVHVAGSVHNEQSLARAVQTAVNQKTIRNGSTQLFISQRQH